MNTGQPTIREQMEEVAEDLLYIKALATEISDHVVEHSLMILIDGGINHHEDRPFLEAIEEVGSAPFGPEANNAFEVFEYAVEESLLLIRTAMERYSELTPKETG